MILKINAQAEKDQASMRCQKSSFLFSEFVDSSKHPWISVADNRRPFCSSSHYCLFIDCKKSWWGLSLFSSFLHLGQLLPTVCPLYIRY